MYKKIYLDAPDVGSLEKEYLNRVIVSGYVSTVGPFAPELEARFSRYLNIKKAVSLQSGTAAIHLALYELGIGRGDEVIVPALTFVATVNPVIYVGATPVFVDVDTATWNISPQEIEKAITKKTKAIITVHLYGNPCRMDEILKIGKKYGLYIIEDATESLGAKYKTKFTGTLGEMGCFSFNGNKIITTGGGGMIAGNNEKRLNHIEFLANQAKGKTMDYYHPEVGFNYRMTNIEAALGLAQLKRLSQFLTKKRKFKTIYQDELRGIKNIRFQEEYNEAHSSSWFTCIIFENKVDIAILMKRLNKKWIPTRRVFMPLTEFPPYKKYKRKAYKNSYYIYERGLCLPSSTLNSEDDIYFVCSTIKRMMRGV